MDIRHLTEAAFRVYKEDGLRSFIGKAASRGKTEILGKEPFDTYCYRKSLLRLNERMKREDGIDDILNTVGYTVVDPEAVRTEELRQNDTPYSGYGQFPGKYSGYGVYSSLKMQQGRRSFKQLATAVAEENPETILEIGSANGGSFYSWCRFIDSAKVLVSLDIDFPGRRGEFFRAFSPNKSIKYVEGNSQKSKTYERVNEELEGEAVDFLYIDGGHEYEQVKHDFETYSRLLSDAGLIGLHDISHPGTSVPRFWNELQDEYGTDSIGEGPVKNGLVRL